MATILLFVIFLAFICLGMPVVLLGAAWPVMQPEYGLALDAVSLISIVISASTVLASLVAGRILRHIRSGIITLISCLLIAGSLIGFTRAPSFGWLIGLAIPLGLGSGLIDVVLNHFVAAHYQARHMNWLHSSWGLGATIGPIIIAGFMTGAQGWRGGYQAVAVIIGGLALLVAISQPIWRRMEEGRMIAAPGPVLSTAPDSARPAAAPAAAQPAEPPPSASSAKSAVATSVFRSQVFWLSLLAFFFYTAVEATMVLWSSSYLVQIHGLTAARAARWASAYLAGVTIGRLLSGFVSYRINNKLMIRVGQILTVLGGLLLIIPGKAGLALAGLAIIGLGCAPIFPSLIHETPKRFGQENAKSVIGYQMALAYVGYTFIPPLVGWAATRWTLGLMPAIVLIFSVVMLAVTERLNVRLREKS